MGRRGNGNETNSGGICWKSKLWKDDFVQCSDITGSKQHVGNWPGVTVEKKEGEAFYEDWKLTVVDTPGIYSLTCYTIEEKVTRQAVMDDTIDVIVNVVDASSL